MTTEKIANFIARTEYAQIPQEAISGAKKCILDCLGVTLAAHAEPVSKIMTDYVIDMGGKAEAGVIGQNIRTTAAEAALVNGSMAHALDYDDYYGVNFPHATATTLPAVLALAERERSSGRAILEAYILGCEVGVKIGIEISARLLDIGWHSCAILGSLSSAVGGAKILGLGEVEIRRALGIAASEAAGLRRNFGTDTKPLHAGNAGRSGVVASLLAKKGLTADENILDGAFSLSQVLLGKELDLTKVSEGLGAPFFIISPGAGIKPYPSCGTNHRSITAILELIKEYHINADEVAEVECKVPAFVAKMLVYNRPKTGLQGKFSMQYCMAAALLDGEVGLKQFTDEKVLDAESQALIPRVKCVTGIAEGADPLNLPQIVTVKMHDGREYRHQVPYVKGDAQNPMRWEEVKSKFEGCAYPLLSPSDTRRVIELVANLESLDDISDLMEIVTTKAGGSTR